MQVQVHEYKIYNGSLVQQREKFSNECRFICTIGNDAAPSQTHCKSTPQQRNSYVHVLVLHINRYVILLAEKFRQFQVAADRCAMIKRKKIIINNSFSLKCLIGNYCAQLAWPWKFDFNDVLHSYRYIIGSDFVCRANSVCHIVAPFFIYSRSHRVYILTKSIFTTAIFLSFLSSSL